MSSIHLLKTGHSIHKKLFSLTFLSLSLSLSLSLNRIVVRVLRPMYLFMNSKLTKVTKV